MKQLAGGDGQLRAELGKKLIGETDIHPTACHTFNFLHCSLQFMNNVTYLFKMIQTILLQLSIFLIMITIIYAFIKKYMSNFLKKPFDEIKRKFNFTTDLF